MDYAQHLEDMMPQNRVELNLDEDGDPIEPNDYSGGSLGNEDR